MNNENLETALSDLCEAIRNATLGSIEDAVIDAAARELISNWNDHNEKDDQIDETAELANWAEVHSQPHPGEKPAAKPAGAPRPGQAELIPNQLYAPNGKRIIASKDWIPGNALIQSVSRNADGSLDITWDGETQVCWDGQHTDTLNGQNIYLDEDCNEWPESKLHLAT